jgi:hypothetical protein
MISPLTKIMTFGPTKYVYRVPGFLSSRPNWLPPPPDRKQVLPPPLVPGGGTHPLGGGGEGGANADEGTDTLELNV